LREGWVAEAFQSLFRYTAEKIRDGYGGTEGVIKYLSSILLICDKKPVLIPRCDDVGKPLKKIHTWSGVRTRDLSIAK
jgi:hypothetical protein